MYHVNHMLMNRSNSQRNPVPQTIFILMLKLNLRNKCEGKKRKKKKRLPSLFKLIIFCEMTDKSLIFVVRITEREDKTPNTLNAKLLAPLPKENTYHNDFK